MTCISEHKAQCGRYDLSPVQALGLCSFALQHYDMEVMASQGDTSPPANHDFVLGILVNDGKNAMGVAAAHQDSVSVGIGFPRHRSSVCVCVALPWGRHSDGVVGAGVHADLSERQES